MTENKEVGKVKFFDHKKGYGFIEVINPDSSHFGGPEIFVHFSGIVCDSQFKKLIPGEIVSMNIGPKFDDPSKTVCKNVKGLFNTKLLIDNEKFIYKLRDRDKTRSDHRGEDQRQTEDTDQNQQEDPEQDTEPDQPEDPEQDPEQ